MGRGTILRVPEGTELLPLEGALKEILSVYQVEYFSQRPDYRRSTKRRIDSLDSAFNFILEAYPPAPRFRPLIDAIKNYVARCKASCDLSKESPEELHKELERFTSELAGVVSLAWQWPEGKELKEAYATLNEAEQYVLMSQGRFDLATLIPSPTGIAGEYILQWDVSIPPYYDQWLNELKQIKSQNFPKTPLWFRTLKEFEIAYFCHLSGTIKDHTELLIELNQFIDWLECNKTRLNLDKDLEVIASDTPPYPSWFNELNKLPQIQNMVKVLAREPQSIDSNLKRLKHFLSTAEEDPEYQNTVMQMAKFPTWYWELSDRQQCFLEYVLKKSTSIEEAVSFLSSRHRTLPAPANFAEHRLLKINATGIYILGSPRTRSSHIVPRDVLHCSQETLIRHSASNLKRVTEKAQDGQLISFQTLISPMFVKEGMPSVVSNRFPDLPDLELYRMSRATVMRDGRSKDILQHNHPFNIAKYIYYTQTNDPDSLALLKKASEYSTKKTGLQELLQQYESVLNSPLGSATFFDYTGREVFLSSIEQLIIYHLDGFSYGSCVSGKDRKAVELIHTDAMMIFKDNYDKWPKFGEPEDSSDRKKFVEIIAALYCSRHQHEHAGQNAPGSEGIKTPSSYFPKDVSDAINQRIGSSEGLARDDRLATDNEVKHIINNHSRSTLVNTDRLLYQLALRQIGHAKCVQLYDALVPLINEKSRFKPNGSLTFYEIPTGIRAIKKITESANYRSVEHRLEEIFAQVHSRPEKPGDRSSATKSVYEKIRDIMILSPDMSIGDRVDKAIQEWEFLFNLSKQTNATVCCN